MEEYSWRKWSHSLQPSRVQSCHEYPLLVFPQTRIPQELRGPLAENQTHLPTLQGEHHHLQIPEHLHLLLGGDNDHVRRPTETATDKQQLCHHADLSILSLPCILQRLVQWV